MGHRLGLPSKQTVCSQKKKGKRTVNAFAKSIYIALSTYRAMPMWSVHDLGNGNAGKHMSAPDVLPVDPDITRLSYSFLSTLLQSTQFIYKKNSHIAATALCDHTPPCYHASRTPSSPLHLPSAFLSTAAALAPLRRAPSRPHSRCRLVDCCYRPAGIAHRGAPHAPYHRGAAQLLTGDRAAARSLSASFSTMTAQPDPAVQCSAYQVLLKVNAVSVCFKCFRFRGMLQVF